MDMIEQFNDNEVKYKLNRKELEKAIHKILPQGYKFDSEEEQDYLTKVIYSNKRSDEKLVILFTGNDVQVVYEDEQVSQPIKNAIIDAMIDKYPDLKQQAKEVEEIAKNITKSLYNTSFTDWKGIVKKYDLFRMIEPKKFLDPTNASHTILKPYMHTQYPEEAINIGEIYFANLNTATGQEMGGVRPVLVLGHNQDRSLFYVLPTTTRYYGKEAKLSIGMINGRENCVLLDKLTSISSARFYNYVKTINPSEFKDIIKSFNANFSLGKADEEYDDYYVASYQDREKKFKSFQSDYSRMPSPLKENKLSRLLDQYPMQTISEEEMMDIISEHIAFLEEKHGLHFMKHSSLNGRVELDCRREYNTNGEITFYLNDAYDGSGQYEPLSYRFTPFSVKRCEPNKSPNYVYDRTITIKCQTYMIDSIDYYALHFIRYLCQYYKNGYDFWRAQNTESTRLENVVMDKVNKMKNHFADVGIIYYGDFSKLVKEGFNAFDINKLSQFNIKHLPGLAELLEEYELQ